MLHKAHLAPASRYSEDIDLVLVANRSHEGIRKDLAEALEPILGPPTESFFTKVRLTLRNLAAKSEIARLNYVYEPTNPLAATASLKVEVNLTERKPFYDLTTVSIDVPVLGGVVKVPVVSYDLDEMLGTKLRALIQRDHGRDLYDLWKALEVGPGVDGVPKVNPARVGAAFRFYLSQEGSEFSAADVRHTLERRMKSRKFLNDMDGYLQLGVTYSPKRAQEVFCEVLLPHLDGSD